MVREVSTVLMPSIGFLSFEGMSIELSSVDTTDKIMSKSLFSSLLLFFSSSLLLLSSLFSLLIDSSHSCHSESEMALHACRFML